MYHEIRTKRLLLRPLKLSDLQSVYEYASDKENTRYMYFLPYDTVEETAGFLSEAVKQWEKDTPDNYEFAIVLDGVLIGTISLFLDENHETAELGWVLNKSHWHNGYAVEAALAIKDFAIRVLRVKKLMAHCDYRNTASYRLMEKIGLKLERDDGVRVYPKTKETARELAYSLVAEMQS